MDFFEPLSDQNVANIMRQMQLFGQKWANFWSTIGRLNAISNTVCKWQARTLFWSFSMSSVLSLLKCVAGFLIRGRDTIVWNTCIFYGSESDTESRLAVCPGDGWTIYRKPEIIHSELLRLCFLRSPLTVYDRLVFTPVYVSYKGQFLSRGQIVIGVLTRLMIRYRYIGFLTHRCLSGRIKNVLWGYVFRCDTWCVVRAKLEKKNVLRYLLIISGCTAWCVACVVKGYRIFYVTTHDESREPQALYVIYIFLLLQYHRMGKRA